MKPARLLVMGGDALSRSGLTCLLEMHGHHVVGIAAFPEDTLVLERMARADAILLDIGHPPHQPTARDLECIIALGKLIVLDSSKGADHVLRLLRSGVSGLVPKTSSPEVLFRCIDCVTDGGRFIPDEIAQQLALHDQERNLEPSPTRREMEVLLGVSRGLPNKRIGRHLGIEVCTVKAHLSSVMRKLKATSRFEAVAIAVRQGLVQL